MEDLSNAVETADVTTPAAESSPVNESAAPSDKAAPAEVDDLDAQLAKVFKNATREPSARAPDGKFLSKNPAPEEAEPAKAAEEVTTDQPQEQKAAEAQVKPAPIDSPVSWSAEMKAKFGTLPPDVQQYVVQRDKETHEHISRLGETVSRFRPIGELLEQNMETFRSKGLNYRDGLSQLLAAQKALDRDPVSAIAHLANVYGVDLGRLIGQEGRSPQNEALTETVKALTAELNALKKSASSREAEEHQQKQSQLEAIITKFSADKPDFADLVDDIYAQIGAIRTANPNLSIEDMLTSAYEKASWANPKTRAARIEKETKAAEQKRIEEAKKASEAAKKAAGVNVKGQPKANADDDNLDSLLAATWRKSQAA